MDGSNNSLLINYDLRFRIGSSRRYTHTTQSRSFISTSIVPRPISQLNKFLNTSNWQAIYLNVTMSLKLYKHSRNQQFYSFSVSKMKKVKSYLWSTQQLFTTQQPLVNLAVLASQNDLTMKLDNNEIFHKLTSVKFRRKAIR